MSKNVKIALIIWSIIVTVLIVLPIVFGAVSGWQDGGWGMMGPGMVGGCGGRWSMPIYIIFCWGLGIVGIVALVRGRC